MTQLIAGVSPAWLVTLPLPTPVVPLMTLRVKGPLRNFAVTLRFTDIVTLQVPVPLQADQDLNEWPLAGVAVRVTTVPWVKLAWHPVAAATPAVMVQLIPEGLEVTTPFPVPVPRTVRVWNTVVARSGSAGWGES
jgi:hypothetical protein